MIPRFLVVAVTLGLILLTMFQRKNLLDNSFKDEKQIRTSSTSGHSMSAPQVLETDMIYKRARTVYVVP